MKNRLLFTTALIAAAFAVSDACAERLVVSSGEEEVVNAEMSANDNSELQGGAILNSGKLTVADGVVFNGNAGSVGGAVSTVDASGAAYRVDGEPLDRFGVELGAGLTAEVNDNVELSLRYEGQFRDDYTDHTGLLNAKYKF